MRIITRILAPLAFIFAMLLPTSTATAAPAEVVHEDTFIGAFNSCNGELISGEGFFHSVFKLQKDGGYIAHFKVHGQGIGDQGNEYVINYTSKSRVQDFNNYSFDDRLLVVSKGSAPNFWAKFHVDSQGNFTIEEDCRG